MIATAGHLSPDLMATSFGGTTYPVYFPEIEHLDRLIKEIGTATDNTFIRRKYDVVILDYKLKSRGLFVNSKVFPKRSISQFRVIRQPPHRITIVTMRYRNDY